VILLCALCGAVACLSGCGNERTSLASGTPEPSGRTRDVRLARAGMQLELPINLDVTRDLKTPAVLRASLGEPFVSAFAYPRKEQLPRNAKELGQARKRLADTTRNRDPTYRLASARATEVAGARTVELLGEQTLSRRRLTVRSIHIYKGRAEYVVEIAAPVGQFPKFDRGVTPLIQRTLRVTGRVRGS
jgi:hypothetical protein